MKINPIAIQSYQQVEREPRPTPPSGDHTRQGGVHDTVTIRPQDEMSASKVAVKPEGADYSANLTPEERQALDLLFSRFRDSGRFGTSYLATGESTEQDSHLGKLVDIKV
jgi:hypothetical protein